MHRSLNIRNIDFFCLNDWLGEGEDFVGYDIFPIGERLLEDASVFGFPLGYFNFDSESNLRVPCHAYLNYRAIGTARAAMLELRVSREDLEYLPEGGRIALRLFDVEIWAQRGVIQHGGWSRETMTDELERWFADALRELALDWKGR